MCHFAYILCRKPLIDECQVPEALIFMLGLWSSIFVSTLATAQPILACHHLCVLAC